MNGSFLVLMLTIPANPPAVEVPAAAEDCKVCVSEPTVKKVSKTVYTSKEKEFCVPHRSLLSLICHEDAPECGPVRYKTAMIKKIVTEEKPGFKCEPKPAGSVAPCENCAPAPRK